MSENQHLWVRLSRPVDPVELPALLAPFGLPALLVPCVNAHRRLRGPFTAAGAVVRAVAPRASADLVERHEVELLSVAPELRAVLDSPRETLTSLAIPEERTRFYAGVRTQRLGHGVVDFLDGYLRTSGTGRRALVVLVDGADRTDLEFLAALVRRTDPDRLTVVVCGSAEEPGEPLTDILLRFAEQITVDARPVRPADGAVARYIAGDGVPESPELVAAYHRTPAADRARLHDLRAAELEALDQPSLALGAIPWHREHGTDPHGAGVTALAAAMNRCLDMGFYHSTMEFGWRVRELTADPESVNQWWLASTKITTSLLMLRRAEEAEELYDELAAATDHPRAHMHVAYAKAMIYTRHYAASRRDHLRAKGLLRQAVAFAGLIGDSRADRLFLTVFHQNGLALAEMHLGDLEDALRLVVEGAARLDELLAPGEHALHRSVLLHNRAQLLARLGRLDEALSCFDQVIALDPNHPDYYIDRGNLRHRLGRADDALRDYATAVRLGPPLPEAEYNRAEIMIELGRVDEATALLDRVIELEPDQVDARVNRASLLLDAGDVDAARSDVTTGLALAPDNPHLRVLLAQCHTADDDHSGAVAAYDQALASDPDLVAALAGKSEALYALGEPDAALAVLDHAVTLAPDDPAIRYNRAVLHEAAARWDKALADLMVAAAATPDDDDVTAALDRCRAAVSI
ncbi:tetratricopeptide repeat protein [Actinokineospora inagensis]|uniref:tetratricopeptide repeat protein n=1 Tax=Actinokineospora inagensis TaxID=103730 RepID=UPI000423A808|nr:tetratricopeptide repeat protein [Actinokineospora inagensis]